MLREAWFHVFVGCGIECLRTGLYSRLMLGVGNGILLDKNFSLHKNYGPPWAVGSPYRCNVRLGLEQPASIFVQKENRSMTSTSSVPYVSCRLIVLALASVLSLANVTGAQTMPVTQTPSSSAEITEVNIRKCGR